MASGSYSPDQPSKEAFRAALAASCSGTAFADRLVSLGRYQRLNKGLALAGDADHDRLVFLAAGAAKLVARSPAMLLTGQSRAGLVTNMQVLAFHFAGDMICVLREGNADFRLIALADCELLAFPTERFLDTAQTEPAVLRWVLAHNLQALHRSRTRMMQMGHKSARQRIADFLVSMAERLGDCSTEACRLLLPMSRRDIGESLGLTIETVSRQFTELREAGLIATEGRSLVQLLDLPGLVRVAGHVPATRTVQLI